MHQRYIAWSALENRPRGQLLKSLQDVEQSQLAQQQQQNQQEAAALAYTKVLRLLREADKSGDWPDSSIGRKTVIEEYTLLVIPEVANAATSGGDGSDGSGGVAEGKAEGEELVMGVEPSVAAVQAEVDPEKAEASAEMDVETPVANADANTNADAVAEIPVEAGRGGSFSVGFLGNNCLEPKVSDSKSRFLFNPSNGILSLPAQLLEMPFFL
jgi:hypothetical protein